MLCTLLTAVCVLCVPFLTWQVLISSTLALINAVVSSPAELASRAGLRSELSLAGFDDVLTSLTDAGADKAVLVQAKAFERDRRDDGL